MQPPLSISHNTADVWKNSSHNNSDYKEPFALLKSSKCPPVPHLDITTPKIAFTEVHCVSLAAYY